MKNTVRRAGMHGRAYADQAMARTLRNIAGSLADGGALYLDGLRARTHVETLITVLRRAKRDRNSELMKECGSGTMLEKNSITERWPSASGEASQFV